jgi:hypothetical protein
MIGRRLVVLAVAFIAFCGLAASSRAAPPAGWAVVSGGTCSHGGIYAEASLWGDLAGHTFACPSSGTFTCASDVDWGWFGSPLTGQLCAVDATDAAGGSGGGGGTGGATNITIEIPGFTLSAEDGLLVAAAVAGVWCIAFAWKALIRVLHSDEGDGS